MSRNQIKRLTEVGQDGMPDQKAALPGIVKHHCFELKEIIMNTKQLIAAAVLTLVGSTAAFAQTELELQHFGANQPSATTRAAVRAEFLRAQASGEVQTPNEVVVSSLAAPKANSPARAEVRTAFVKPRVDSSYALPTEVTMFANDTTGPVRSREEVRAEARAYTRTSHAARVQAGH